MKRAVAVVAAVSAIVAVGAVAAHPPKSVVHAASTRQGTSGEAYCIFNVDANAFPQISATLRLIDNDGNAAQRFASTQITENGKPATAVQLTQQNGPVHYVFIVDGGRGNTLTAAQKDTIKRAIGLLAEGDRFRDDFDEVTVRVLANSAGTAPSSRTEERLGWETSASRLRELLRNDIFPRNAGPTRGLDALDDGLKAIKERVGSAVRAASVIIFITHRIESLTSAQSDPANWAAQARAAHVPIFAFQTSAVTSQQTPVRALVPPENYVALNKSSDAAVIAAYDRMALQGASYALTYTSKSSDKTQRRITPDLPNAQNACPDSDTYTVEPTLPIITIKDLDTELTFPDQNSNYTIRAEIRWPDRSAKSLQSASLVIDGSIKQRHVQNVPQNLDPNTTELEFVVNAEDFAGKKQANISVSVVDSLDQRERSSPDETVQIVYGEPVAPTPTPVPEQRTDPALYAAIGVGVLALIASVSAIVLFTRRRNTGSSGPNTGGWTRGPQRATASLTVLDGPSAQRNARIPLSKQKYVLGRHKADISFYADASSSTVSRVHCTISREADVYWIVDNVSSNGTRVNNHRITPNERIQLNHGDTITLGDVSRNGVQLQFAIEDRTQVVRGSGSDGRTYYKTR
jgi:hypothetical protein